MEFLRTLDEYTCFDDRDRASREAVARLVRSQSAFGRDPTTDHITGSAFVIDEDATHVLLTEHAKLGIWLQLGGHCEGIADPLFVAWKEAYEESGLHRITPVCHAIFDIDIHDIPARHAELKHKHYDIRYLFRTSRTYLLRASTESKRLAWVRLDDLEQFTRAQSVLVLRQKLRQGLR